MITTTLNEIKSFDPCPDVWRNVKIANGVYGADMIKPFAVSSIIDSSDLEDCLWVVAHLDVENNTSIVVDFAKWCALQNIELIKPCCSKNDFDLICGFLKGENQETALAARAALAAETAAEAAAEAARTALAAAKNKLREMLNEQN